MTASTPSFAIRTETTTYNNNGTIRRVKRGCLEMNATLETISSACSGSANRGDGMISNQESTQKELSQKEPSQNVRNVQRKTQQCRHPSASASSMSTISSASSVSQSSASSASQSSLISWDDAKDDDLENIINDATEIDDSQSSLASYHDDYDDSIPPPLSFLPPSPSFCTPLLCTPPPIRRYRYRPITHPICHNTKRRRFAKNADDVLNDKMDDLSVNSHPLPRHLQHIHPVNPRRLLRITPSILMMSEGILMDNEERKKKWLDKSRIDRVVLVVDGCLIPLSYLPFPNLPFLQPKSIAETIRWVETEWMQYSADGYDCITLADTSYGLSFKMANKEGLARAQVMPTEIAMLSTRSLDGSLDGSLDDSKETTLYIQFKTQ